MTVIEVNSPDYRQGDEMTDYSAQTTAICPHCDGKDWDCQTCNAAGLKAAQAAAPIDDSGDIEYQPVPAEYYGVDDSGGADVAEDERPDIVTRLENDPISHAETSALMRQAANEIRALRGALGVTQHTAAMLDREITSLRAEVEALKESYWRPY